MPPIWCTCCLEQSKKRRVFPLLLSLLEPPPRLPLLRQVLPLRGRQAPAREHAPGRGGPQLRVPVRQELQLQEGATLPPADGARRGPGHRQVPGQSKERQRELRTVLNPALSSHKSSNNALMQGFMQGFSIQYVMPRTISISTNLGGLTRGPA